MAAGERPWRGADGKPKAPRKPLLTATRKLRRVLAILAFIFGIIVAGYAPLRENVSERVTSIKDRAMSIIKPEFDPVRPTGAEATTETPENPGRNLIDVRSKTFWLALPTDPLPSILITFAQPIDLDRAIIHNGNPDAYTTFNRAKKLHFVYSTGQSFDVELKDSVDPQQIDLDNGAGASSIQIQVVEQYVATPPTPVALTEIEFFTQK
jgi:hypothetical protein